MEAVPRLPMLSFELKTSPEYVDFGPVLKQYIQEEYGEDPAHYNKACSDLEQLRQSAVHVSHDFMGCSTLKKYYAQLQFLQGRFPMTDGGQATMPFTWDDIFMAREVTLADIKFEQASVLYNIGSLHSVLGAMETRQNADGMKVACTHFQCATWAYEYLRDHFGSAMMSHDFSHDLLTFHMNLMLAQAQECILEKSMIDSRKSSITAKVAIQIVEFYNAAFKALEPAHKDNIVSSRRYKDWKRRMELKVLFYTCITYFYMGKQSEEQQKWGECLAYYTQANVKLQECLKMGKNETSDIQESLRFANDVVQGKYNSAKKDNDFVYHEKVPAFDTLPEIKGASLVKGIPFNPNDPEISGPDIFQKLVPMKAHEASSLYSEEKAKLLRQVCGEIEDKNTQLVQFMTSLNLDPAKLNYEPEKLPQQLLEKCAAVSVKPNAIKDLVDAMGAVSSVATDVDLAIKEIKDLLEMEDAEEQKFQEQFGKRDINPTFDEIRKEFCRFEEGHKKGSQSNSDLHKAMNTHITNLRLLGGSIEAITNALPSITKGVDPEDEVVVQNLRRLLSKVDEMKEQRNSLESQLRSQVQADDITSAIVTQETTNKQAMFEKELQKHEKTIGFIKQNLSAQENILKALTDANAKYATIRQATGQTTARREAMIADLINSYDVYEDLLTKSQKGLDFYKKLEGNVTRLLSRCRDLCQRKQQERQAFLDKYKPKVAPPPRPDAAKPGSSIEPSVSSSLGSMHSSHGQTPRFDGPKLKDYLPFMKPKTFGKDRKKPGESSSVPGSHSGSPVRLPHQPDTPETRDDISLPQGLDKYMGSPLQTSLVPDIQATNQPLQSYYGNMGPSRPGPHSYPGPLPNSDALGMQPGISAADIRTSSPGAMNAVRPGMNAMRPGMNDPRLSARPDPNFSASMSSSLHDSASQVGKYHPVSSNTDLREVNRMPGGQIYGSSQWMPPQGQIPQHDPVHHPSSQRRPSPSQSPQINTGHPQRPSPSQSPQINTGYSPHISPSQSPQVNTGYQPHQLPSQSSKVEPQNFRSYSPGSVPESKNPGSVLTSGIPPSSSTSAPGPIPPSSSFPGSMPNSSAAGLPQQQQGYYTPGQSQGQYNQLSMQGQNWQDSRLSQQPVSSQRQSELSGCQSASQTPQFQSNIYAVNSSQSQGLLSQGAANTMASQAGEVMGHGFPQNQMYQQVGTSIISTHHASVISPANSAASSNQQYSQMPAQTGVSSMTQGIRQHIVQDMQSTQNINQGHTGQSSQPMNTGQGQNQTFAGQGHVQSEHLHSVMNRPIQNMPGQQSLSTHPGLQQSHGQQMEYQHPVPMLHPQQHQGKMPVQQNQGQMIMQQQQGQQPRPGGNLPVQQHQGQVSVQQSQGHMPLQQNQSQMAVQQSQGQQLIQQKPHSQQFAQQQLIMQQQQPPGQQHPQMQPQPPGQQMHGMPYQGQIGQTSTSQAEGQSNQFTQGMQSYQPQLQQRQQTYGQVQPQGQLYPQGMMQPQGKIHSQGQIQPQGQMQPQGPLQPQGPMHPQVQLQIQGQLHTQGQMRPQGLSQTNQFNHTVAGSQHSQGQQFQGFQQQQIQGPRHQGPGQQGQGQQVQHNSTGQIYQASQTGVAHPQQHQLQTSQSLSGQGHGGQGHYQQTSSVSNNQMLPQSSNQSVVYPMSAQQTNQNLSGYVQQMPLTPDLLPSPLKPVQSQGQTTTQHAQNVTPQPKTHGTTSYTPDQSPMLQPQAQGTTSYHSDQSIVPQPQAQGTTSYPSDQSVVPQPQAQGTTSLPPNPASHPQVKGQTLTPQPQSLGTASFSQGPAVVPSGQGPASLPKDFPNFSRDVSPYLPDNKGSKGLESSLKKSHSRQLSASSNTSLDDILSSSPNAPKDDKGESMLTPKVLTEQEKQQQKEEAIIKSSNSVTRSMSRDPYSDPLVKDRFVGEVEKFAKYVESLGKATCSGPTNLDLAWKELVEEHEKGGKKTSMAIARCYPAKNRDVDVMPYDETRVILTTLKDDYINASWITDLSPSSPKFIATQSPLPVTLTDFWVTVYEQGSEVIVMLTSDAETGKKFPEYWPNQKGIPENYGPISLTLQSVKDKQNWIERIIYLNHMEKKQARTIVHLQYKKWPVSGFPENISHLLQFITTVHNFYRQQRSLLKPVIVHCSNGTGRTGIFMLVYTGMQEMDNGSGIINVQEVAKKMFQQRRLAIKEKFQLKYVYEAILYYAQDILAKQGILVHKASFGDKLPHPKEKTNQWTPTEDILFGTTMSLNALQSNVAKLGLNIGQPLVTTKEGQMEEISKEPVDSSFEKGLSQNLPDVVQRVEPKAKDAEVEISQDRPESGASTTHSKLIRNNSNSSLQSLETVSHPSLDSVSIRSLDMGSERSLDSVNVSHEGSPLHKGGAVSGVGSGNHLSLAELQDPKNFTVGSNDGKKKITKANFESNTISLTDNLGDPNDPLNSLDPLWSIKK